MSKANRKRRVLRDDVSILELLKLFIRTAIYVIRERRVLRDDVSILELLKLFIKTTIYAIR